MRNGAQIEPYHVYARVCRVRVRVCEAAYKGGGAGREGGCAEAKAVYNKPQDNTAQHSIKI